MVVEKVKRSRVRANH